MALTTGSAEVLALLMLAGATGLTLRHVGRTGARSRRLAESAIALLERGRPLVGIPGAVPSEPDDLAFALDELGNRWQHEWQQALEERRRLQSVLAGMEEGIILLDRWGRVLVANKAARNLWPRLSPRLRGMNQIVLFQDAALDEALNLARRESAPQVVEHLRPGPPRRYYEVRILPLPQEEAPLITSFDQDAPGAAGLLLVVRDVTDRRAVEQMRRDFVANVSHELQTPLTSIQGFAETLLEDGHLAPDEQRRFLNVILRQSRQMSTLVNDLLELARLEARDWRTPTDRVALDEVAREVIEASRPRAANKRLVLDADSLERAEVIGNRDELSRAIDNLVANAIAYTPEDGRVWLRTGRRGEEVFVEVGDTGIGIPVGEQSRIFERFYRVDKGRSRKAGGTGLGLAIVRHVVEAHGGRVDVTSAPGAGSSFTCLFPAAAAETIKETATP